MRSILSVLIVSLLAACASRVDDATLLTQLQTELKDLPHECVPLGWNPVPLANGVYYPGFSAEFQDASWIKPLWLGSIRDADLRKPEVAVTHTLLMHLRRAGMVESVEIRGGTRYRLSTAGFNYYYDGNAFKSNPDHLRYLCYSKVVPSRVTSTAPTENGAMHVVFQWRPGASAAWSSDSFIRAHSVVLSPFSSPATAYFKHDNGVNDLESVWKLPWTVYAVNPGTEKLPRVVNASAWHTPRS